MKVKKYEAVGIAASIAIMAIALFLTRVDLSTTEGNQSGTVFVDGADQQAALGAALGDASSDSGRLEQMIVNDVILGSGDEVEDGDTIEVHYIGTLQNGQQFDNSYQKGEPFSFTVGDGKVIEGWDEGVVGMKVGGQRILVVPAAMAYGREGFGPIPGGATLVFAIELLSIE